MNDSEFCQMEAAQHRAVFLGLEGDLLRMEVREPAIHLAKALRAKGFDAEPAGTFTIAIRAGNWNAFWAQAGPLIDCGC